MLTTRVQAGNDGGWAGEEGLDLRDERRCHGQDWRPEWMGMEGEGKRGSKNALGASGGMSGSAFSLGGCAQARRQVLAERSEMRGMNWPSSVCGVARRETLLGRPDRKRVHP